MKHVRVLLLCVISGLLTSFPHAGDAQLAPVVFRDDRAAPALNDQIRMDSELVIIRLNWKSYTVDGLFHLFNTGATTTQWVGVPKVGSGPAASQVPGWVGFVNYDFISFDAWVNGRKIEFTEAPGPVPRPAHDPNGSTPVRHYEKCGWMMVKQVTFPGHARTTIRVRYEVGYKSVTMQNAAGYDRSISRYWKDKIRKSVFMIDSTVIGGPNLIKPTRLGDTREILRNLIRYEVVDHEPTPGRGLSVAFHSQRWMSAPFIRKNLDK